MNKRELTDDETASKGLFQTRRGVMEALPVIGEVSGLRVVANPGVPENGAVLISVDPATGEQADVVAFEYETDDKEDDGAVRHD